MMDISLHSVVILVGTVGSMRREWAEQNFQPEEIVSADQIRIAVTGRADCFTHEHLVFGELFRQTKLRLGMGQRVVVDAPNLKRSDRTMFEDAAFDFGVACAVVVFDQTLEQRMAAVITSGQKQLLYIQESMFIQALKDLQLPHSHTPVFSHTDQIRVAVKNFRIPHRLLAVGDVHGNHAAMQQAVKFAQQHQLFVIWLGDIIDYGSHNLKCMKLAYDMVCNNQAHQIWGNHERKIGRWINTEVQGFSHVRLSEANQCTVREIQSLNNHRKLKFLSAWHCWETSSTQCVTSNAWLFTHGAATEHMWNTDRHRLQGVCENMAYFGEVERSVPSRRDAYPQRLWNWVNTVPAGHSVVVGHDWLDRQHMQPVIKENDQGGRVFCMDTGCGKGGPLSAVMVDTQTNEWETRAFDS